MKRKFLTLGLSLCVLASVCVPGTLAIKADAHSTLVCEKTEHTHTDACYIVSDVPTCGLEAGEGAHAHDDSCYEEQTVLTCTLSEDETHTHGDGCYTAERVLVCGQEESEGHQHDDSCYSKELTCTLEEHQHSDACYLSQSNEQPDLAEPICTCGTEDGVHTEGCPLYQAPAQPEEKECTCGAVAGEDGTIVHAEDCPLYVAPTAPETPVHIEGCSDDCTVEGCSCPCHKLSLFDRLMACETYEELMEMIESLTEEEIGELTEEQVAQIDEKALALEPAPLPEVISDEPDDEPADSEIIYPTVNFDHVAPFGAPVVG